MAASVSYFYVIISKIKNLEIDDDLICEISYQGNICFVILYLNASQ